MSDDTTSEAYAHRLERLAGARWKQVLDVQRPYRWNIRQLDLGRTLDVGCGIGRHLESLPTGSLGVDHNPSSIEIARSNGLNAITTDDFDARYPDPPAIPEYDSILLAHVLEHMTPTEGLALLEHYLPHARRTLAVICPQEKGYTTDATHVTFLDADDIAGMLRSVGLRVRRSFSFPFPGSWVGCSPTTRPSSWPTSTDTADAGGHRPLTSGSKPFTHLGSDRDRGGGGGRRGVDDVPGARGAAHTERGRRSRAHHGLRPDAALRGSGRRA